MPRRRRDRVIHRLLEKNCGSVVRMKAGPTERPLFAPFSAPTSRAQSGRGGRTGEDMLPTDEHRRWVGCHRVPRAACNDWLSAGHSDRCGGPSRSSTHLSGPSWRRFGHCSCHLRPVPGSLARRPGTICRTHCRSCSSYPALGQVAPRPMRHSLRTPPVEIPSPAAH
jgi:hypothetical protein